MGKRITQLDAAGPLTGAEKIPMVQEGRTVWAQADSFSPILNTGCQCTLVSRTNTVGTDADTLEKFLQTWQMPANILRSNGEWIEIIAWGELGVNGNNKTLTFYFGGTSVTSGPTAARDYWNMLAKIHRVSATEQNIIATFKGGGGIYTWAATSEPNYTEKITGSENLLNDVSIAISGTNGTASANDITIKSFIVEHHQIDTNS